MNLIGRAAERRVPYLEFLDEYDLSQPVCQGVSADEAEKGRKAVAAGNDQEVFGFG